MTEAVAVAVALVAPPSNENSAVAVVVAPDTDDPTAMERDGPTHDTEASGTAVGSEPTADQVCPSQGAVRRRYAHASGCATEPGWLPAGASAKRLVTARRTT